MGGRGTKSSTPTTIVNPSRGNKRQDIPVPNVSLEQALGKRGDNAIISMAQDNANPNFSKGTYAWTHNCQRCVWAYEMLKRGYNVEARARKSTADQYCYIDGIEKMAGRSFQKMGGPNIENTIYNISSTMAKNGEGSRAFVTCFWKSGGGHIFMCEQTKTGTIFVDPQTHRTVDISKTLSHAELSSVQIMRTDNININSLNPGDLANVIKPSKRNVSHIKR